MSQSLKHQESSLLWTTGLGTEDDDWHILTSFLIHLRVIRDVGRLTVIKWMLWLIENQYILKPSASDMKSLHQKACRIWYSPSTAKPSINQQFFGPTNFETRDMLTVLDSSTFCPQACHDPCRIARDVLCRADAWSAWHLLLGLLGDWLYLSFFLPSWRLT